MWFVLACCLASAAPVSDSPELQSARKLIDALDYEHAACELRLVARATSDHGLRARALVLLGATYAELGTWAGANLAFEHALDEDPAVRFEEPVSPKIAAAFEAVQQARAAHTATGSPGDPATLDGFPEAGEACALGTTPAPTPPTAPPMRSEVLTQRAASAGTTPPASSAWLITIASVATGTGGLAAIGGAIVTAMSLATLTDERTLADGGANATDKQGAKGAVPIALGVVAGGLLLTAVGGTLLGFSLVPAP